MLRSTSRLLVLHTPWAHSHGPGHGNPQHRSVSLFRTQRGLYVDTGASVQRRWASVEARVESQRVTVSFHLSPNLHEPGSALMQESAPILASRIFLKPSDPRKDAKPSRISDQAQGLTEQWSTLRRPLVKGHDSSPSFQERADAGSHSARSVLKNRDPPQAGQVSSRWSGVAKRQTTKSACGNLTRGQGPISCRVIPKGPSKGLLN